MKYSNDVLQAAIDAAMIEIGNTHSRINLNLVKGSTYWGAEPSFRLALAKAFLECLPQPGVAAAAENDMGRVAYEAMTRHQFETTALRAPAWENAERHVKDSHRAMAHAVLAQAIRHMEAVPVEELSRIWRSESSKYHQDVHAVRARLIAAASGEAEQQLESKPTTSTFEAHGKTWTHHDPDAPMPCDGEAIIEIIDTQGNIAQSDGIRYLPRRARSNAWKHTKGWRYADEPDSTDWKAKYEQAEAELAALKSSPIGILRPLAEAGPVSDGCVRVKGYKCTENDWCLAHWESRRDTHFADIRLPVSDAPAQTVDENADPYARLKAYAKAGARIRVQCPSGWSDWKANHHWSWAQPVEQYEVFPPDLRMVPEYAPHVSLNGLTQEEEAKTASVAGLAKAMSHPGVSDVEQFHGRSSDLDKAQDALRYVSETFDAMGIPSVSDDGRSLSCQQRADLALAKMTASAPRQECVLQLLAEAGPVPAGCERVTAFQLLGSDEWLIGNTLNALDTHFIDVKLPGAASPYATPAASPPAIDQAARIRELENRLQQIQHLTQSVSS